jgi:ribosomal protein S18 acetylase RimI-like enzyme
MENVKFMRIERSSNQLQLFIDLWLLYMHEIGDERSDDRIVKHANKILEIQEQQKKEGKIYNIELCMQDNNIIGFCFFTIGEIKLQKDTEYGFIIKPLVNNNDYGFIMEFYINPEYRLQGCGKTMYYHIEEIYKESKINKIVLTADAKAICFWEKLGFCNSGKIDPGNDQPLFLKDI